MLQEQTGEAGSSDVYDHTRRRMKGLVRKHKSKAERILMTSNQQGQQLGMYN
jgi:hypothetical protein